MTNLSKISRSNRTKILQKTGENTGVELVNLISAKTLSQKGLRTSFVSIDIFSIPLITTTFHFVNGNMANNNKYYF